MKDLRSLGTENPTSVGHFAGRGQTAVGKAFQNLEGFHYGAHGNEGGHVFGFLPEATDKIGRYQRANAVVNGHQGPVRYIFQGVFYRMEAGESAFDQALPAVEIFL